MSEKKVEFEWFLELSVEQQQFIAGGQSDNVSFVAPSGGNDLLNSMNSIDQANALINRLNGLLGSGGFGETTKNLNSNNVNSGIVLY